MKNMSKSEFRKSVRGFTLIEVMIAVFVFAIGLLGLAGLQLKSHQYTHMGHARTIATLQASSLIERMRTNQDGVSNGDYVFNSINNGLPAVVDTCFNTGCDSSQMADTDLNIWFNKLEEWLPGVQTVICLDSSPELQPSAGPLSSINCDGGGGLSQWIVYVDWVDQKNLDGEDPANTVTKRFTMSFIP